MSLRSQLLPGVTRDRRFGADTGLVRLTLSRNLAFTVRRESIAAGEATFRRPNDWADPAIVEFDGQVDLTFPANLRERSGPAQVRTFQLTDGMEYNNPASRPVATIGIRVPHGLEVELTIV